MSGLRLLIYPVKYSLTELSNAASRLSIFFGKIKHDPLQGPSM